MKRFANFAEVEAGYTISCYTANTRVLYIVLHYDCFDAHINPISLSLSLSLSASLSLSLSASPATLLLDYFAVFGTKSCCFDDLQSYFEFFSPDELKKVSSQLVNLLSLFIIV